jgi:hypothetical protein
MEKHKIDTKIITKYFRSLLRRVKEERGVKAYCLRNSLDQSYINKILNGYEPKRMDIRLVVKLSNACNMPVWGFLRKAYNYNILFGDHEKSEEATNTRRIGDDETSEILPD